MVNGRNNCFSVSYSLNVYFYDFRKRGDFWKIWVYKNEGGNSICVVVCYVIMKGRSRSLYYNFIFCNVIGIYTVVYGFMVVFSVMIWGSYCTFWDSLVL